MLTLASSFRFLYLLYSILTTIPAWRAVLSMCLYIDKVIPTSLKAIQNADRWHIVKITKIINTFQLLNISALLALLVTLHVSNLHNQAIKISLFPVHSCKNRLKKKKLPKTIKLEPSRSTWVQILHLPTILADQDLNQEFSTAGHNHLVGHQSKLMGQTLFINEIDNKSVSHEGQILFHQIHQFQYYIHIYKAAM